MSKNNIIIAVVTFVIAFGTTFYIIRTYFPKQKIEQANPPKESVTKTQ